MAPAYSNTQFTQSHSSLVNPTLALSSHENTNGSMSRGRNHRRNPREAATPNEYPSSQSSNVAVHMANHGSHSMVRSDAFSGGSSSRRAAAASQPSPPEAHGDGRHESTSGKRRYRGAFAAQGPVESSGTAGKAEDRVPSAVLGSGSGSGGSSSGRAGSGGLSLTEENVRRTSSYYENLRRENAGERGGESSGRRASLLATLEEAGSKLSGARR